MTREKEEERVQRILSLARSRGSLGTWDEFCLRMYVEGQPENKSDDRILDEFEDLPIY